MSCRVALYGASLFMAVIEAVLAEQPGYTIVRVDPSQPSDVETVAELAPQVLFIDDATCPHMIETLRSTLCRRTPETTVIVLALKSFILHNQMQRHPIENRAELMDLIQLGQWPNRCD